MLGACYHQSKSEKVSGRKRIDCKSHHALLMSTLAIRSRTGMVEMTKEAGGFKNNLGHWMPKLQKETQAM